VSEPLISVIVPAYNVAQFLPATLDSIVAQTEERWECIVVDDGSSDDTHAVATGYARNEERIQVVRVTNGGASHARNAGFRRSSSDSEYISFMDSDDVWLPDALATLLRAAAGNEQAIGSHGLGEMIDAHGAPIYPGAWAEAGRNRLGLEGHRLVRWPLDRPTSFAVLVNGNVLFPPGLVLARRRAYELAGPFDEALNGPEDWDMLIRLSRFGDLEFVNDVILGYRRHEKNLGANPSVPRLAWLVRCIAFHSPENSPKQQDIARRGWRAYQVRMAIERLASAGRALARGRLLAGARDAARIPVYAWRYLRGYPRPRVIREPLTW
jgi:glycosyltransferase involved in cell wall biosynthesis